MKMICDVPDEVIKSVKMGTWCGSSVAEKMIANGTPLDEIRAEIEQIEINGHIRDVECFSAGVNTVLNIIDKYKVESDIEKRKEWSHKPCINYEDGCEEWAGCPCVYYKAESEE